MCHCDSHFVFGLLCRFLDHFLPNMKFSIEFTINRLTLCLQHRAAELAVDCGLGKVLFPVAPTNTPPQTELPKLMLVIKSVDVLRVL